MVKEELAQVYSLENLLVTETAFSFVKEAGYDANLTIIPKENLLYLPAYWVTFQIKVLTECPILYTS